MDSAKQTAAPDFLAPDGKSKKKRETRKETVKGNRIRGEKKLFKQNERKNVIQASTKSSKQINELTATFRNDIL